VSELCRKYALFCRKIVETELWTEHMVMSSGSVWFG